MLLLDLARSLTPALPFAFGHQPPNLAASSKHHLPIIHARWLDPAQRIDAESGISHRCGPKPSLLVEAGTTRTGGHFALELNVPVVRRARRQRCSSSNLVRDGRWF